MDFFSWLTHFHVFVNVDAMPYRVLTPQSSHGGSRVVDESGNQRYDCTEGFFVLQSCRHCHKKRGRFVTADPSKCFDVDADWLSVKLEQYNGTQETVYEPLAGLAPLQADEEAD